MIAFNHEGSVLAGYSAEDACICTWTAGSGGFWADPWHAGASQAEDQFE